MNVRFMYLVSFERCSPLPVSRLGPPLSCPVPRREIPFLLKNDWEFSSPLKPHCKHVLIYIRFTPRFNATCMCILVYQRHPSPSSYALLWYVHFISGHCCDHRYQTNLLQYKRLRSTLFTVRRRDRLGVGRPSDSDATSSDLFLNLMLADLIQAIGECLRIDLHNPLRFLI